MVKACPGRTKLVEFRRYAYVPSEKAILNLLTLLKVKSMPCDTKSAELDKLMVVSPANPASGQHTLPTPSRCTRHVLADGQGMSRSYVPSEKAILNLLTLLKVKSMPCDTKSAELDKLGRSHVLELSAMVVSPANPASGQHTLPTPSRCTRHGEGPRLCVSFASHLVVRDPDAILTTHVSRQCASHVLELSAMVVSPANPASGQHTLPTPSRCTRHVLAVCFSPRSAGS
jgi:hypothetical protein